MKAITCADVGADAGSRQDLVDSLPAHGVQLVIHDADIQQMRDWSIPEATVTYDSAQEVAVNFVRRGKGKFGVETTASQIHNGIAKGRAEIDMGAMVLLLRILRLSLAFRERIMIGR